MKTIACQTGMHFPLGKFTYWLRDPRTDRLLELQDPWIDCLPRDLRHRIKDAQGRAIELANIDLVIFSHVHARMMQSMNQCIATPVRRWRHERYLARR